jgi:hypothetical protein
MKGSDGKVGLYDVLRRKSKQFLEKKTAFVRQFSVHRQSSDSNTGTMALRNTSYIFWSVRPRGQLSVHIPGPQRRARFPYGRHTFLHIQPPEDVVAFPQ